MVLLIVEVSQKQAFIFGSNKLRDNVEASAQIAWVTSPDYFMRAAGNLYTEDGMVYAGGGHTVLCFENEEKAKAFSTCLSKQVLIDFPEMDLFIKVMPYDEGKTLGANLIELTRQLEKKKALRVSSFHQGTFGIDAPGKKAGPAVPDDLSVGIDRKLNPAGYESVWQFEDLGGGRNDRNFIAIVHADGNGMGARVSKLYKDLDARGLSFDEYKREIRAFSDGVDEDFKAAYQEMLLEIVKLYWEGRMDILDTAKGKLPVRRIITSGDDICFVAEGRIGIEAARIFLEKLSAKTNVVDHLSYAACAGVAIVHVKYPFFKAYELAESLCSNAKKKGAMLSPADNGSSLSLIDWHLEFGELQDTLEDERADYVTGDGENLCGRPYLVKGQPKTDVPHHTYETFRQMMELVRNEEQSAVRSKIKELRQMLKKTESELKYFSSFYHLGKLTQKKEDRDVLFDAIELMDLYLDLGEEAADEK